MTGDHLRIDVTWRDVAEAQFTEIIVSRGLRAFVDRSWSVDGGVDAALPGEVLMYQSHAFGTDEWLLDIPGGAVALLQRSAEVVNVRVAAPTREPALAAMESVRAALPMRVPETASVPVVFWTISPRGPRAMPRTLAAPEWSSIAANYPAATGQALAPLFAPDWRPPAGRLVLWRGAPGTGKTHALRAAMQAWRAWCTFHIVLDAEPFFALDGTNMLQVLCSQPEEERAGLPETTSPWRVLVLEDSGELLGADAAVRAGQGLSRLLNLCDGLLGQSLKVMVLITTNEDLGRIHSAVSRAGRCVSHVEFTAFDADAARRWLAAHGLDVGRGRGPATLADLYARLDGRRSTPAPSAVGF